MRERTIGAIIVVAVTLGPMLLGRYIFAAFVALIIGMVLREIVMMFQAGGHQPLVLSGYMALLALLLTTILGGWGRWATGVIVAVVTLPLLALFFTRDRQGALLDWALTVAAVLYVALPAVHFLLLRSLPGELSSFLDGIDRWGRWQTPDAPGMALGLGWYLLAQIVTWLSDVAAYLVGRQWGRRKLAPAISPGKTVEGAIGGLVAGSATAWLCAAAFGLPLVAPVAFLVGAILSVAGQFGDLAESLIKRQSGVKDSGEIIPGHGGVFDRIDSLLIVVTVTYYLAQLLS